MALVSGAVVLVVAIGAAAFVMFGSGHGKAAGTRVTIVASPHVPASVTHRVGPFAVTVRWAPPSGGPRPQAYALYRVDALISTVTAPAASYTDRGVLPGHTYRYRLVARVGNHSSSPASFEIKTPVPSLASARLEGAFDITATLVTESGYQSFPKTENLGWLFTPKCATGPCDVTWGSLGNDFTTGMHRSGASYAGTVSGRFGRCGSAQAQETWTLHVRVLRAHPMEGAWRATRIQGTLTRTAAPQLGCVGPSATESIVGTLPLS